MDSRRSESKTVKSGIYILGIYAEIPFEVNIKKFKDRIFPAGNYYYVGSAQKNLQHRLNRHIRKDKNIHWHIDHVTSVGTNRINKIYIFPDAPKELECRLANHFENKLKSDSSIKAFGNSDSNCSSTHLFYSEFKINQSQFSFLYHSMVLRIPSSKETS